MNKVTDVEIAAKSLDRSALNTKKVIRLLGLASPSISAGSFGKARLALDECLQLLESVTSEVRHTLGEIREPLCDYLRSPEYFGEVAVECKKLGLQLENHGDSWYCFPSSITLHPDEESVLINGSRTSELMPGHLAARLYSESEISRNKNLKLVLEIVFKTYLFLQRGHESSDVLPVLDVFDALTLWPEQKRHYSKFQFALDLYLIDRSGKNIVSGKRLMFASSTGARDRSKVVSIRTENGDEKVYYGIYFAPEKDDEVGDEGR